MKNQWTNKITGYVKVRVQGRGAERYLNRLLRGNIVIWDAKKIGTETVVFFIHLNDIPKMRAAGRSSDCKISFIERRGGPFFLKKIRKYNGLAVGLFTFFLIIFLLSNMVWGIHIKGATPATEHQIRKELDKMNVKVGKLQWTMDDMDEIQKKLSDRIPSITWVGVQLQGTTFHFQVVEKKQPKKQKDNLFVNLVASKRSTVMQMLVEKGQGIVDKNQVVEKGQILVSGYIGKEGGQKFVGAKGKVLAETWYKTNVELPLETRFSVFNGDYEEKHALRLWNQKLPLWGFKAIEYPQFAKETDAKSFRFLKWNLPIEYEKTTYRSKEFIERTYAKDEAIEKAKRMAEKDLKKNIPKDAVILHEKVLHNKFENGKVKLIIHYQVLENIAIGQPIIQGD